MKKILLIVLLLASSAALDAQKKEEIKLQKADESEFITVDSPPALKSKLLPAYPEEAKVQAIEGKVFLKLLIDEKGNVASAKIEKSAHLLLDNSALEASKKAKFSPALIKGKPVKVWVVLPIVFKLDVGRDDKDPDIDKFVKFDVAPEMKESANPVYPEDAKKNGITGKVYVKILIDHEGKPKKAVVIKSENEMLNQPAIDAAMKSTFTPAKMKGEPLSVWIVLPYKFALDGKAGKK